MDKLMEKCKAAVAAFPEIELAYWFGSRAKGKGTPLSDWNFEPCLREYQEAFFRRVVERGL